MGSAPVLSFPDFTLPFIVEIDASIEGLGAVLSQKQESRTLVIAYASRRLKKHERCMKNFSSMKLELMAMTWAITKKFKDYLYGSKFTVLTDNNPLTHVMSAKRTVAEMGWLAELADFDFDIKYRTGKSNVSADVLSRHPVDDATELPSEEISVILDGERQCCSIPDEWLVVGSCALANEVLLAGPTMVNETASSYLPSYMPDDICQLQENDIHISRVLHFVKDGRKPGYAEVKRDSLCVRRMLRKFSQMHLVDGILFRKYLDNGEEVTQLVIPESLKSLVLQQLHDAAGHQGKEHTGALVRSRCYWPSMYQDITKWCEDCSRCFTAKEQFPKVKARMYHLTANQPCDILAVDFTLLEKSTSGLENVLVITDIFSKYTIAVPTKDQKAKTVARVLVNEWFLRLGIPRRLHSDQGRSFENKVNFAQCIM